MKFTNYYIHPKSDSDISRDAAHACNRRLGDAGLATVPSDASQADHDQARREAEAEIETVTACDDLCIEVNEFEIEC